MSHEHDRCEKLSADTLGLGYVYENLNIPIVYQDANQLLGVWSELNELSHSATQSPFIICIIMTFTINYWNVLLIKFGLLRFYEWVYLQL